MQMRYRQHIFSLITSTLAGRVTLPVVVAYKSRMALHQDAVH